MDAIWQDVRYAARTLSRAPVFALAACLTLALGIGANGAFFTVLDAIVLRNLPVHAPDELVAFYSRFPGEPRNPGFNRAAYEHYRRVNSVFSDLIAVAPSRAPFELRRGSGASEPAAGDYVSDTFFTMLGVRPAVGRLIQPGDESAASPVVVLSWSCWQRRFNLDPSIVNQTIHVNGEARTVIGVAAREFFGVLVGSRRDIWMPLPPAPAPPAVALIGRLKPDVSLERAGAEMRVLDRLRDAELSKRTSNPPASQVQLELVPAGGGFWVLRDQFSTQVLILMGVAALLILIACTSLASLLLARGASRRHDLAMRVALGAGRARMLRHALAEAALLLAAGTVVGIVVAWLGADALVRSWHPDVRGWGPLPVDIDVAPDARILLFTTGLAVLCGLLFGTPAAWSALVTAPASVLRESKGVESNASRLFGDGLVVAQVAVSVVLANAAGLLLFHLGHLRSEAYLGFRRDSVVLVSMNPRGAPHEPAQLLREYEHAVTALEAIPGVKSATLSAVTPVEGPGIAWFATVEGVDERPEDRRYLAVNVVGPRYFETFGTPLIAGREFRPADRGGPPIAIVNQAMARHYFGERSPLGRHLTFDRQTTTYEIVGVAGDAKYSEFYEPSPRTVYLHAYQQPRILASQFAVRASAGPSTVAGPVRHLLSATFPAIPVTRVTTLAEQVDGRIAPERLIARLASLFGGFGALLAAIGLYGLLAYAVAQQTKEIGIRMALGATRWDVTSRVLGRALRLVLFGLAIGIPAGMWSRRLVAATVQDFSVGTPPAAAAAAIATIAIALLAAYMPARRASRVDPMEALRTE